LLDAAGAPVVTFAMLVWPAATSVVVEPVVVVVLLAVVSDEAGGFAAAASEAGAPELPAAAVVVLDWPAVAWFAFCWVVSIEFDAAALDWLFTSVEVVLAGAAEDPLVEDALVEGALAD
jgi:hypothetical protein